MTAMENREHLSAEGFRRLLDLAVNMNVEGGTEGSIGHPESSEAIRRTRASAREEMVRPPWRHGEPGGTETTAAGWRKTHPEVTEVSVPILRGRRRFEESCP